jgi:hypothetical protein
MLTAAVTATRSGGAWPTADVGLRLTARADARERPGRTGLDPRIKGSRSPKPGAIWEPGRTVDLLRPRTRTEHGTGILGVKAEPPDQPGRLVETYRSEGRTPTMRGFPLCCWSGRLTVGFELIMVSEAAAGRDSSRESAPSEIIPLTYGL